MVLQQGAVQDIYSFQIGMKPQILNLTRDLGRFAAQMAPQMEDLGFHANLERVNILTLALIYAVGTWLYQFIFSQSSFKA